MLNHCCCCKLWQHKGWSFPVSMGHQVFSLNHVRFYIRLVLKFCLGQIMPPQNVGLINTSNYLWPKRLCHTLNIIFCLFILTNPEQVKNWAKLGPPLPTNETQYKTRKIIKLCNVYFHKKSPFFIPTVREVRTICAPKFIYIKTPWLKSFNNQ